MDERQREDLDKRLIGYYNELYHSAGQGRKAAFNNAARKMFDFLERLETSETTRRFGLVGRMVLAAAVCALLTALDCHGSAPVRNACAVATLGLGGFQWFFSIAYSKRMKTRTETREMRRARTVEQFRRDFEEKLLKHPYMSGETETKNVAMGE